MNLNRMLKVALVPAITLFGGYAVHAQNIFTIKGQLGKNIQGKIYLQYKSDIKNFIKDSSEVTNGAFSFKGEISDPYPSSFTFVKVNGTERTIKATDYKQFFLEGAAITVISVDSLDKAIITGGKAQADFRGREIILEPLNKKYRPLAEQQAKYRLGGNMEAAAEIQKQIVPILAEQAKMDSVWVVTHPSSYPAFLLWSKKQKGFVDATAMAQFNCFSAEVRKTEEGKIFAERVKLSKNLAIGNFAPDFTVKDTLGKQVTLSSLKGKYVMLLFWEMGNIMPQMYDQFAFNLRKVTKRLKDKNFVVLGVNYDNESKWHEAIKTTTFNWVHTTDFGGIDNDGPKSDVAKSYGLSLRTIPMAFLIAPDGKIVDRRLPLLDNELSLNIDKVVK